MDQTASDCPFRRAGGREAACAERRRVVIETARRLTPPGVEVLKAEFSFDIQSQPHETEWVAACVELTQASRAPWLLLSASVSFDAFLRQVAFACRLRARSVAVGRAVWQKAPNLAGEDRRLFLQGVVRTAITDGDLVRLRVSGAISQAAGQVTFHLDGSEQPVAECAIASGGDSCETAPFKNLGWDWSPGPWKITLWATDGITPTGADFALTAHFKGGAILRAQAIPFLPQVGQPVELIASLALNSQPLQVESAESILRQPDGETQTVALSVSENQAQGSWEPDAPGLNGGI